MRKFFLFLLVALGIPFSSQSQNINQEFVNLIRTGNYFALRQQYSSCSKKDLYPAIDLMVRATMECALGQPEKAIEKLDSLLIQHTNFLGEAIVSFLYMYKAEQLNKLGRYKDCVVALKKAEPGIENLMSKSFFQSFHLNRFSSLTKVPPSEIIKNSHKQYSVPLIKDTLLSKRGIWAVSINTNNNPGNFLLDTGSFANLVSEDFAKKCNVKILADSIPIHGGNYLSKLGVIDNIRIGSLTYTNVVVHVINLDNISKAFMFQLDGVFGSPFFTTAGKIDIYPQKNKLVFPKQTAIQKSKEYLHSNMSMPFSKMEIEVYLDKNLRSTLLIDTGAEFSWINSHFLHKNRSQIDSFIHGKDSVKIALLGGAGAQINRYLPIKEMPITINETSIHTGDFMGWENEKDDQEYLLDGGLGCNYLRQAKCISFDFKNMIFSIEPRKKIKK